MVNGGMDTMSLIVVVCVIIPALLAIAVCLLIFRSHRNKNRKFQQRRNPTSEYHHSPEQLPQENYTIDCSSAYRYQQQRRLSGYPPVSEQSPPSYDNSIDQTRRQQLPLFSPIRTIPSSTYIHRNANVPTPSRYATMPPTYAEIFPTLHTRTN